LLIRLGLLNPAKHIEDSVEAVKFNVTGNTVAIDFKMKEYNLETHFASTVMMRNYGQL